MKTKVQTRLRFNDEYEENNPYNIGKVSQVANQSAYKERDDPFGHSRKTSQVDFVREKVYEDDKKEFNTIMSRPSDQ